MPPAGLPKPPNEPNGLGLDEDVESSCAVPKLDEDAGLSLPKRLLVEDNELLKTFVVLEPEAEEEPKSEVPVRLKGDVPDVLALDEVPNNVDELVLVPVAVESKGEAPEDAPDGEDAGGKEKLDVDPDDELEPKVLKPANGGGVGTEDGFEFCADGADGADGNGFVDLDDLSSNSV